ncbi:MAG: hypothetical protein HDR01_09540 [Lachnospiraceae bacterium]|nr:hypothetical protein [Lachnospiraceae bacterium]
MGMMGIGNSNVERYTFKNPDGTVAGSITVSKPSVKKTKRLQYKYKRISSQLMAAKTAGSARMVITMARSEAANLRKKLRCGEYDDSEVNSAIIHADQMVRIAQKRVKHLEEEERAKKSGGICQGELEEKESFEDMEIQDGFELDSKEAKALMREMEEAIRELENENGLEELTETVREDMDPADLELLKKKHRSKELREIMEADMKYLKALFGKLEKERQAAASSGVSLELSGTEMPVPVMEAPVEAAGGSIDESV